MDRCSMMHTFWEISRLLPTSGAADTFVALLLEATLAATTGSAAGLAGISVGFCTQLSSMIIAYICTKLSRC